jgi:hypothetical protein
MLNKLTINQTHYLIFEKMQFDSLYAITKDIFFKHQAKLRSDLLKSVTPINVVLRNGYYELVLLRATPPHPYNIDMYRTQLQCLDKNKKLIINQFSEHQRQQFLFAKSDKEPSECFVYAHPGKGLSSLLFKTSEFNLSQGLVKFEPKFSVKHDAIKKSQNNFEIDPQISKIDRGEIGFQEVKIDKINELFGFDVNISTKANMGIVITDSLGNEFFRYYPALEKGQNLVILSPLGFDGIEKASFPLNKIDFHIYTHNQNNKIYVNIGKTFVSGDALALRGYVSNLPGIYTPHDD